MKKRNISLLTAIAAAAALAPTAAVAVTTLTAANVTYDNSGVGPGIDSIDGLNFNITALSGIVVTNYNKDLTIKVVGVTEQVYSSGNPTVAQQGYISNSTVNEVWSFGTDSTEPYDGTFEANLTSSMTASIASELNQVALILFEAGGNDTPTIQAYNGTTALGNVLAISEGDWGDTGATTYGRSATGDTSAAVGISLSDLGVTTGQTVTKFVFGAVENWDVTEIMVDSNLAIPEPGAMSLLALGGLALLRRRRA